MREKPKMSSSVTQEQVDEFIGEPTFQKLGQKTTLCFATLKNGYEMVVSSGCVDPANYNKELGQQICLKRLNERVWELLGFNLQCKLKAD